MALRLLLVGRHDTSMGLPLHVRGCLWHCHKVPWHFHGPPRAFTGFHGAVVEGNFMNVNETVNETGDLGSMARYDKG